MQATIPGSSMRDFPAAKAIGMWSASSCDQAIRAIDVTEAVVNVQSNEPGAFEAVISVLAAHGASVKSGIGGQLAKVVGIQFFFEAAADQIDGISRDIVKRFPVTPPVTQVDDFNVIDKWTANHVISVFVYQDREGVLADVFDVFRALRVNAVSMHAATGPTTRRINGPGSSFRYWGRVTINAYIPNKSIVAEVQDRLSAIADEVSVTAIPEQKIRDTMGIRDISRPAVRQDVVPAGDRV